MTQNLVHLKQLGTLADLVLDRDLAQLATVTSESDQVRTQLLHLEIDLDRLVARRNEETNSASFFTLAGDTKWQAWRQEKKSRLNSNLAKIESEREIRKVKARIAFGRAQVVKELLKKRNPD